MTLDKLYKIIQDRKTKKPADSYVASLFEEGLDRIVQKVGEEAVETVIAGKSRDRDRTISETADLWFHSLIMLAELDITPGEVLRELENRKK